MLARLSLILFILSASLAKGNGLAPEQDPGFEVFRDRCMACHLQTGMGIRAMNAPSIAGLPRWYVADQLRKFRRDQRGFHDDDAPGKLMQANAIVLDERSIAFVGRHIESLSRNPDRNTADIQASNTSKKLYEKNCASCHGDEAEGLRSQRVPPLTSQQDWYLQKQMENFQTGKRDHDGYAPGDSLSDENIQSIIAWITDLPVHE